MQIILLLTKSNISCDYRNELTLVCVQTDYWPLLKETSKQGPRGDLENVWLGWYLG